MRQVGVLEAKTNFSSLVAEVVETGEPVTITRHGAAQVRMVPATKPKPSRSTHEIEAAVRRMQEITAAAERRGGPPIDFDQFMREIRERRD